MAVNWDSCTRSVGSGSQYAVAAKDADGKESNWLQTVPDKGWCTILRLYSPLEPWFDKTWQPGEIELID